MNTLPQGRSRAKSTSSAELAGSYLRVLKARGADVGVWEIRGRIFSRILAHGRDARLSGAEWSIMANVALHLEHLGRSRGMMSVGSLADDCMVTERTVRNALRTLAAQKFITIKYRMSGQVEIWLDRRFGPRAPVPGDKSADKSPRRCAPRKKISTTRNSNVKPLEFLVKDECTDSAAPQRRHGESPDVSIKGPNGSTTPEVPISWPTDPRIKSIRVENGRIVAEYAADHEPGFVWHGHDPPRKRV